jgi:predicted AlkP superfamily pyrophosphatase or phosphodiesterase
MKLKKILAGAVVAFSILATSGCSSGGPSPSLVVYVVIDQLRGDMLDRYDQFFTGGFRRLHDEGYRFLSATHDHGKTATAAGHATLSTGVFPSRNGIVNNQWRELTDDGWTSVYSVEDTMATILGLPAMEGRSPQNLLRGGIADWIVDADSAAIIVSASRKDRAAISMAGKTKSQTYWITDDEGRFVTSSFYADKYPTWVERLNREEMPRIFGDPEWEQTLTLAARMASRPDTAAYEGDGTHTFFPHLFENESSDVERRGALNRWAYSQVYPDEALAAFAREAIRALGLGEDEATDYLGLSFSQTDAIGHDYGPLSREQLQNLIHLDGLLGDLMAYLDEEVGPGRWVMALTGDHGVLTMPEYLSENGQPSRRATEEDFTNLREVYRAYQDMEGDPQVVQDSLAAALERLPFVADALTVAELTSPPAADSFVTFMRNSYHPDRWIGPSGSQGSGVTVRYTERFYPSTSPRQTGHGTPYYYDRHVPLIFLGGGLRAGESTDQVGTVDIAPTLAALAGIAAPSDLDGRPLFD